MSLGKRCGAEFLGTFWLVFGGCGSAVLAAGFPQLGIGFAGVALAFGLTLLTMAYAIGHISGCHINPAVSVGLCTGGRFPVSELIPYIVAQVVGEQIEDHEMHAEEYSIPRRTKELVDTASRAGRPVLAVGTTVVRTLEAAWSEGGLSAGGGSTRMFIRPGFAFKVVNQLLTNFHTPRSSLLVLVSAFAGRELILNAYSEAVEKQYRFFSFGDAMLIR